MRKLWIRRRAVSTMIGGIIVLAIILAALVAMVIISQQYDVYQGTVKQMSQEDVERNSENLQIVFPGLTMTGLGVNPCAGSTGNSCKVFLMTVNNLAGIGTQLARIYINSSVGGCTSLCVFDTADAPTSLRFRSVDSFINPSEALHQVTFWVDNTTIPILSEAKNMISVVTTRGRVFSFQWPMPVTGQNVPSGSLYIGCLAINFDNNLTTYTGGTHNVPPVPLRGGWLLPGSASIIIFVRVSNICISDVVLLDRSTFYAIRYTGAGGGASVAFFLSSPMSANYCSTYFPGSNCIATTTGNTFPQANYVLGYNYSQTPTCASSPTGDPCYILPAAASQGKQGQHTYLLFSATDPCYASSSTCKNGLTAANSFQGNIGQNYVIFLAMFWRCTGSPKQDPTCTQNYEFGVTLPFITIQTCDPTNKAQPYCT